MEHCKKVYNVLDDTIWQNNMSEAALNSITVSKSLPGKKWSWAIAAGWSDICLSKLYHCVTTKLKTKWH